MAVQDIYANLLDHPVVQTLRQRVDEGGVCTCPAVNAAAIPFLTGLLTRLFPQRLIIAVTEGVKSQELLHQDLQTWLHVERAFQPDPLPEHSPVSGNEPGVGLSPLREPLFYPAWEILPHESKLPHADVISERLETLIALTQCDGPPRSSVPVIVTSVVALLQKTYAPVDWSARVRLMRRGDVVEPLDLIEWLEAQGYEPEAQVNHKGEIALRGGIVDVYPLSSPWPVRLEFFGNELESLRYFDPQTQISRTAINEIILPPAGELGILKQRAEAASKVNGDALVLATLLDYLPANSIFLLADPRLLEEHARQYANQVAADNAFFTNWNDFCQQLAHKGVTVVELSEPMENLPELLIERGTPPWGTDVQAKSPDCRDEIPVGDANLGRYLDLVEKAVEVAAKEDARPTLAMALSSLEAYRPLTEKIPDAPVAEIQRRVFMQQMHRWLRQGLQVVVFCNNSGERQRFQEIWEEFGFHSEGSGKTLRPVAGISALSRGFIFEAAKLVVVTDAEVFGRYKIQRPRRLKSPHAQAMRSALEIDFAEMEEGDFVVHLQHGIGRFLGLRMLPMPGARKTADQADPGARNSPAVAGQECLVIEYAPSRADQPAPKLYVPLSEAHLVSKYVGAGKARPMVNVLGGKRWAKAKEQTEQAVRDVAAELLAIQAARETQVGFSFGADTPWQREFESAFLYEETPDQWRAITDTKRDMESPKPMDRLICGDVGFGKTEVAIRATFKAVMAGKQVAVLTPTTVLAQQHFNTFTERMADYPVRVELLSRFRSRREQQRVLEQLAAGGVDIVVGTHRLVQEDVTFKDLGLVVIDEEQRFGVLHKERLKRLRHMVDVLTMSATPIPRTLHLALMGTRDMSTIETPPQDRLPVETIVMQYDERVIREAIQRELNREGQVFFLHNRVLDIDAVAARIQALAPKAKVVVGHGQMDADELEKVMTRFINGEADVLVSTSIIESGLDIPNANTIIIDRADRFGLSDLYQLRGRVGRYKHQAFAYLLIPRHAALLSDARKRISAIRQYAKLGSGFKIAMRDLEIRGAGNLLGTEQSGHINAVGFELYCQLLKQSVSALKGERVKPRLEVMVRIDFLATNPGEEGTRQPAVKKRAPVPREMVIQVPRETAVYADLETVPADEEKDVGIPKAPAYIPMDYISESSLRIEIYRKLAQVTERTALEQLQQELRDRFGPLPEAVVLLWSLQEVKILAMGKGVSSIETRENRLMLSRNNDFITLDGKFPRLEKRTGKGRLSEIRRLLLAL